MKLFLQLWWVILGFALLTISVWAGEDVPPARMATFKRGVSIAHWLAKVYDPAGPGGPWFGESDIKWIAAQGFDHIRFPVDPRLYWRTEGTLDEAKLVPLVRALHWTCEQGLGAVIDLHFLPGGVFDKNNQDPVIFTDPKAQAEAAAFLKTFAQRFIAAGPYLRIELLNEPMAPRPEQLNELNAVLIAAVRAVDQTRVLYVTSNLSSTFVTLPELKIPADPYVAIVLHYDEPPVFTHQRASWKQCPPDMPLVEFPGRVPDLRKLFPPEHFAYQASLTELTLADIETAFARAEAWLKEHAPGKEIYLGEFGVYEAAPDQSRRNYIRAVSQAAATRGWGWAIWSYNASMAVRAPDGKATPVLEGLFPSPAP